MPAHHSLAEQLRMPPQRSAGHRHWRQCTTSRQEASVGRGVYQRGNAGRMGPSRKAIHHKTSAVSEQTSIAACMQGARPPCPLGSRLVVVAMLNCSVPGVVRAAPPLAAPPPPPPPPPPPHTHPHTHPPTTHTHTHTTPPTHPPHTYCWEGGTLAEVAQCSVTPLNITGERLSAPCAIATREVGSYF